MCVCCTRPHGVRLPRRSFDARKRDILRKLQEGIDRSPKGSLDEPIRPLVHYINTLPDYVRCPDNTMPPLRVLSPRCSPKRRAH